MNLARCSNWRCQVNFGENSGPMSHQIKVVRIFALPGKSGVSQPADGADGWTLPISADVGKAFNIGSHAMSFQLGAYDLPNDSAPQ